MKSLDFPKSKGVYHYPDQPLSVRVTQDTIDAIDEAAVEQNTTKSGLIRWIINDGLKRLADEDELISELDFEEYE